MLEYQAEPNGDIFIRLQLAKTDTGLYPQAKIYAISDPSTVVDTVNLAEIGNGLYGLVWTNNGIKTKYFTQTIVYTNSGHTNVHALIRPDSDSINIGFNSSGFSFGGAKRGTTVLKHKLTKSEIEAIAKATLSLIKPILKKKSEFNPKKDKVKTDIKIEKVEKEEPFPTVFDITKSVVNSLNLDSKLKALKPIKPKKFPVVPTKEDISIIVRGIYKEFDYTKFDELAQVVRDNKVEVPDPIDNTEKIEGIEAYIKDIAETMLVKNLISSLEDKVTKKDVLNAINSNQGVFSIYQMFKQLNNEDKQKIFNQLSIDNIPLLKALSKFGEAEQIVKEIEISKNKNKTFKQLVNKGRLNKGMLPLIKLFRQNA